MTDKKRIVFISVIALFCCFVMAVVDGFWKPGYWIKAAIKICFFLILPVISSFFDKGSELKQVFKFEKKGFKTAILLCVPLYLLILGAYLLLKDVFDFSAITGALTGDVGVNRENFIIVALYISFVNSLLEEFFFRGFVFLSLKKFWDIKAAYILSAALFAAYHIAIMSGWFSVWLFLLAMVGLFVGGIIFNFLNSKSNNIYTSWLVHMFANFAINTIGCMLFGII